MGSLRAPLHDDAEELQPLTSRIDYSEDVDVEEAAAYFDSRDMELVEASEAWFARRSLKAALIVLAGVGCGTALVLSPIVAAARQRSMASAVLGMAAANETADNWGEDCYAPCGGPGLCPDFCGRGNACCRFGAGEDPPECGGIFAWGSLSFHTCVVPTNPVYQVEKVPPKAVAHWGDDCLANCNNKSGYCAGFCGMGNACCKWGTAFSPPECEGILAWGSKDRHTCVAPTDPVYVVSLQPSEGVIVDNWGQECLTSCKNKTGFCQEFCGAGNACCLFTDGFPPPECSGVMTWGAKDHPTCVAPVHPSFVVTDAPEGVLNWAQDCLPACSSPGYCQEFCGLGNACCLWNAPNATPECTGVSQWGSKDRHTCVAPESAAYIVADRPKGSSVLNWGVDCMPACKVSGFCRNFCGLGNACCQFNGLANAPECRGVTAWGSKDRFTCVAPVDEMYWLTPSPFGKKVEHWGADCYTACHETGGACPDFCGVGNACCRFGSTEDPPECHGITQWGSKEQHTCVAPVAPYLYVNHFGEDCWKPCDGAGYCDSWCGEGNACCQAGRAEDPHECKGVTYWPTYATHTCVRAAGLYPGIPVAPAKGSCIPGESHNAQGVCTKSSVPALMNFYVYYAATDDPPDLKNVNAANLQGMLWYLHSKVVTTCPRNGGLSRVLRFVATVKSTDALLAASSSQLGTYQNFNAGECSGNETVCTSAWDKYGYVVGCQNADTLSAALPNYQGPVLYSFPGGPGIGECSDPDGTAECTWKVEYAGEIRIDEISGILDETTFCEEGQAEYIEAVDKGNGTNFWNKRRDAKLCSRRVEYVQELFKMKYPAYPVSLGEPTCDIR